MKVILASMLTLAALSCSRDTDTVIGPKPPAPEGYPFILTFTEARYDAYAAAWARFSAAYGLPAELPEFDSVLLVPVNIPQVDLLAASAETLTAAEAQQRARSFLADWGELFNTTGPWAYSCDAIDNPSTREYGFWFASTAPPPSPLSRFNRVFVRMTHDGVLLACHSTFVPERSAPDRAAYSLEEALRIVTGRHLVYYPGVRPDTLVIRPEMVEEAVLAPTLVPTYRPVRWRLASIEYRTCWRLKIPVAYVFVDAITGAFLDYNEQYVIFRKPSLRSVPWQTKRPLSQD